MTSSPADDPRRVWVEELRAVGPVVAGVAHDLNNPLAGILGYCHLLRTERDPERLRSFVGLLNEQALAARDLIAAFQAATATPELRMIEMSARDLVGATLALWSPGVDAGLEVDTDAVGSDRFEGDPDPLRRALCALLDNALHAVDGRDRPGISLASSSDADRVFLDVRDNGPGIAIDDRVRVFDPRFTSRRSGHGVGLGLPTALGVLLRHGGDVLIEGNDSGAVVRMVLPAA